MEGTVERGEWTEKEEEGELDEGKPTYMTAANTGVNLRIRTWQSADYPLAQAYKKCARKAPPLYEALPLSLSQLTPSQIFDEQ